MSPPPFPSPTATWHDDTYEAINPRRPELSMKGKNVIVTGGGRGIGREIVRSFAVAGAKQVSIIGRSEVSLEEAKATIGAEFPSTLITAHAGDMVDLKSMKRAAEAIGTWDVLVLNAGYMPDQGSIETADVDDWWLPFEVNVKGNFVVLQAFLSSKNTNATVIGSSTAAVSFPIEKIGTLERASYTASKLATVRLMELLGVENPDLRVITVHPGAVETEMADKLKVPGVPMDKIALPADFTVWLAGPDADFLNGKFVWVNWDVDELKAKADKIKNSAIFTSTINGWPYSP